MNPNTHVLYSYAHTAALLFPDSTVEHLKPYDRGGALVSYGDLKVWIERVEVWSCQVWVLFTRLDTGRRWSRFLSKVAYLKLLGQRRKANSEMEMSVQRHSPTCFEVHSERSGKRYEVQVVGASVRCQCPDHARQVEQILSDTYLVRKFKLNPGRLPCKHIFKVLRQLGFSSLNQFVQRHKLMQRTA